MRSSIIIPAMKRTQSRSPRPVGRWARLSIAALAGAGFLIAAPRGETLQEIFARKIAYTTASPFYKELHTPHLRKFPPQPWHMEADEFPIDVSWSIRAQGAMQPPGPFAVEELRSFFRDAGGIGLAEDGTGNAIVLRLAGAAANRIEAESYALEARPGRIEIASPSWRGVLYGVYFLEQILLERGAPVISSRHVERRPVYDVRMFGDVYGTFTVSGLRIARPVNRDTFSALSRFGANATFTFVQLGDYLDGSVYPELANPDREKNLAELARLAELAKSAGLDLYLDAYNPKLPEDHPVFTAHPNSRGAHQFGNKIRSLCSSDPETLKFIADSWADVFRRVPSLGGMVAIIGGEGFYHCYMRAGKDGPDCPRCRKRAPEDVVAGLTNAVFRAIRKVKPDAELLAWPYSAFVWSKDPFQLGLIGKLDPGIQIVPEIDKDYLYKKNGYTKNIWDYSIDFLGPSDRYRAMSAAARRRGLKVCCKTETAVSMEMNGVPYIPAMKRWGERAAIIRGEKPDSIYYAYDITGFARSRPEELAGRLSWTPSGTAEEEIKAIARRDFGPAAADKVVAAWADFSEAMGHTSYLTHGYYMGPSFIGPGQPLMMNEDQMPRELFGRFFYLAETDLSEGTSEASRLRPIYAADVQSTPAETADMEKAAALWEGGVSKLSAALDLVRAPYRNELNRELDLSAYLGTAFRAVADSDRFFARRRRFEEIRKSAAKTDASRREALALLDEMERIAASDLANAKQGLEIARRDPRLDLAVRLDLDDPSLVSILEAKIRYAETIVPRQFTAARAEARRFP
jgi:hypothetical protein